MPVNFPAKGFAALFYVLCEYQQLEEILNKENEKQFLQKKPGGKEEKLSANKQLPSGLSLKKSNQRQNMHCTICQW